MADGTSNGKEVFSAIYRQDGWHGGSGKGSRAAHTRGYLDFLQRFLAEHRIKSVLDLGCGDWQFSRHVNWSGIEYLGYDVVPEVITANQQAFARPGVRFQQMDFSRGDLPEAELVLIKDVLQHWPNTWVLDMLPRLERFPLALVTNCIRPSKNKQVNQDIPLGNFRPLDLRQPPFNRDWPEVNRFRYAKGFWPFKRTKWEKAVFLYTKRG